MYQSIVETPNPDVILVEEAGDILEAHIVTDFNNYAWPKEKDEGYDLNVSLFERLVTQGRRFIVLEEKHRGDSDIPQYPCMLAYPEWKDAPSTLERDPIRGLENRLTFVHHEKPEDTMNDVGECRDPTTKSRNRHDMAVFRNRHETLMVLKTVRFLSQNGYETDGMVALTPDLGHLSLLKDARHQDTDPILGDRDSHDLVRAEPLTPAAAKIDKKRLRLSTIVMTLETFVLSMLGHDLSYYSLERDMERFSSAMETFMKKTSMLLKSPEEFDTLCPDSECAEPCGAALSCGKHFCNRRSHRVKDHSNVGCAEKVDRTCARGHKPKVPYGDKCKSCIECTQEDEDNRRRIERNIEL
ncbi:unnamed protein product [Fusarium equiseti]|uniref:Uncharacterized protein n=1 Tax=Fusarium equiseti TaxID=61235 RepID=A0A8J2IID9_FUSEQ|nr:unnamed protein product [Fusarium equiseti]